MSNIVAKEEYKYASNILIHFTDLVVLQIVNYFIVCNLPPFSVTNIRETFSNSSTYPMSVDILSNKWGKYTYCFQVCNSVVVNMSSTLYIVLNLLPFEYSWIHFFPVNIYT